MSILMCDGVVVNPTVGVMCVTRDGDDADDDDDDDVVLVVVMA